jgi:hypothetical protein
LPFFVHRHEVSVHGSDELQKESETESLKKEIEEIKTEDFLYNYHRGKLVFGLILF